MTARETDGKLVSPSQNGNSDPSAALKMENALLAQRVALLEEQNGLLKEKIQRLIDHLTDFGVYPTIQ